MKISNYLTLIFLCIVWLIAAVIYCILMPLTERIYRLGKNCFKVIALFFFLSSSLYAEDWMINGKTLINVKVGQIEADRVHITWDGGLGSILIADMPPDLKKRFAFDPVKAKAEAEARDAARAQVIALEEAKIMARPKSEPEQITASASATPVVDTSAIQAQIAFLQSEIAEMNKVERNWKPGYSKGAYPKKIAEEEAQIIALKAQLHAK